MKVTLCCYHGKAPNKCAAFILSLLGEVGKVRGYRFQGAIYLKPPGTISRGIKIKLQGALALTWNLHIHVEAKT
jgi:hypothetical protein